MSIAAEDWDDLSAARRRRDKKAAAETAAAATTTEDGTVTDAYGIVTAEFPADDDSLEHHHENLRLVLASYILREWHRDRAALVCLVGALPLPITIFSLLT